MQAGERGCPPKPCPAALYTLSFVLLPSPPHSCAPGSEIQTARARSRQQIYGPRGKEGGAGSQRRGRETAWRPINTSEWEVTSGRGEGAGVQMGGGTEVRRDQ